MKYTQIYPLFLIPFFLISCEQNQTNVPKDNITPETKDIVTFYEPGSMTWNVKQDRIETILVASYKGVFRYDARLNDSVGQGKSFTSITSTLSSPGFRDVRDVLEDLEANDRRIWFEAPGPESGVYRYNRKAVADF